MSSFSHIISEIVNYHNGNFTPTVILWTLFGIIGAIITILNLRDAIQDADALVDLPPVVSAARRRELLTIAKAGIRTEVLRLSKMLTIVGIGIAVAATSPAITDAQRQALHIPYWTPTGVALTIALLYIVAVIVVQAVLDRNLRHAFYSRTTSKEGEKKITQVTVIVPEDPKTNSGKELTNE